MSSRLQSLTAFSVLAVAAMLVGSAFGGSSSSVATPSSSFTGTSSSGGSSSFSGSGTLGGSREGSGSDDSGSFGQEAGGGGTLGIAASGPAGATAMTVAGVRRLQADLARLGYFHHVVTGYYGLVTTAAVRQFQQSAGLTPDGIFGPLSKTALKKRLAGR